MNSFASWLKTIRKDRNLLQDQLAGMAGMKAATISRVENELGEVLLTTAYAICQALEIPLIKLLSDLDIPHEKLSEFVSQPQKKSLKSSEGYFEACITYPDLVRVQTSLVEHPGETLHFLTDWFNTTLAFEARKSSQETPFLLTTQQVENLSNQNPIISLKINYPSVQFSPSILPTHQSEGVLLPVDVGEFLRKKRCERNETLSGFSGEERPSKSALSRLESGSVERFRLIDILELDREFHAGGMIIDMYWNVARYLSLCESAGRKMDGSETGVARMKAYSSALLIFSRWWQISAKGDYHWVEYFREGINKI